MIDKLDGEIEYPVLLSVRVPVHPDSRLIINEPFSSVLKISPDAKVILTFSTPTPKEFCTTPEMMRLSSSRDPASISVSNTLAVGIPLALR